jgi:hypothetical protein
MDILKWLNTAQKYAPIIKTGVAALSTYAAYKDQKKKNEMQQAAYDDYMAQAAAAGHEARAAIDINYTPMTVSGVPTTKADVTDFTKVAAKGGLMTLPQRKRYYAGTDEEEVMEMDEEVLTPYDLQMEEGVNIGPQVKMPGSSNSRQTAWNIWNSGAIPQEIYEFDFEIFFDSGDWMDMFKGEGPAVQENTMMASDPGMGEGPFMMDEYLKAIKEGSFTGEYEEFIDQIDRSPADYMGATGGIAGLRHGGRPGYKLGTPDTDVEIMDEEFVGDNELKMEEGVQIGPMAGGGARGWKAQEIAMDWAWDRYGQEFYDLSHEIQMELYGEALDLVDSGGMKKGGRVKRNVGGIMDLGGLEKDYRTTGGFVPIGEYEKKDDVPARLSKNEFVMTADAVRAAGGGSINKGAQRMYDTMKHLEAQPQAQRMIA